MVVLGWGWVGWGGAMTFMSTCTHTHTSCYVIVMFSCTLHTHVMLRYGDLLLHLLTHVMLRYGDLLLHLLTHVMLRYGDLLLHLHTHTSCAPFFLQMETVLGSHMPKVWKSNMPKCLIKTKNGPNKCEEPPFFPVHCDRDANRWQMVERPFQDGCMMESTQKNTLNWKSFCWRKSLGPLTPHRFLEELCKAVKAMKRFWEEGKKCCIPKKHELMSKNEVVLEIFKTLFFTSTWEKMTFRCSENDIFVDEKLLKPYGRLWVGNLVVVVVVVVAVVVEVRVFVLVKLLKLVKLVKLISVYFFDISTSKKAQNTQLFTLLTSKCASRHNGVHLFDTFSTSEPPKVVRDRQFLTLLTWKCASRHNGVHFFNISTSKSGPKLRCFVHFDLEMCFAPQRRALFQHLNFQKWSEAEVFCTFWLGNVLRATTACTFSTSQLPKVVREWCVLYILTWKCASRHNGVQFFISHLASWLRTRRFSEPTFRPSGATNHWKNTVFRDFPTFSRIWIFCLLTLSLLIFLFSMPLPCSAFHLSILSEVWLLNFLRLITINHY